MKRIIFITVLLITSQNFSQEFLAECDNKIDEIKTEKEESRKEYSRKISDAARGYICSKCSRTKFELERSGNQTFQEHLTSVSGIAIKASMEESRRKENELKREYAETRQRYDDYINRVQEECDNKMKAYIEEQKRLEEEKRQEEERKKLEAQQAAQAELDRMKAEQEAIEAENERHRQEQMRIALANQRAAEADLLNYTRNELNAVKEISRSNVTQQVNEIYEENEEYLGLSIGSGLSEKNSDYSFDSNEMSDEFSDITYDDEDFTAYTDESNINNEIRDDFIAMGNRAIELVDNSSYSESFLDNTAGILERTKDFFGNRVESFKDGFERMKQRATEVYENGANKLGNISQMLEFDEAALAGFTVDEMTGNYSYSTGSSISTINEYVGHYNSQSEFIDKVERRGKKYLENLNNYDPGYNVDDEYKGLNEDYKYMWFDMVRNKTGININRMRAFMSEDN